MTDTSGRKKMPEEALKAAEELAGNILRDSSMQFYEDKADNVLRLIRQAALASPPTQEPAPNPAGVYGTAQSPTLKDLKPALRGGKVEEIARDCVDRIIEKWVAAGWLESQHLNHSGIRPIVEMEIAAALRSHAGESAAQSERAGLERAAKWHDEQAFKCAEEATNTPPSDPWRSVLHAKKNWHKEAAKSLRPLSAARKAGGE